MSAFGIFALILTTAYIIYFAVIISRDVINGRKNPEEASNVETFDVSSFSQEEAMEVRETDGGFAVGETETVSVTFDEKKPETTDAKDESANDMDEKLKKLKENMTDSESDVEMEAKLDDVRFMDTLIGNDKGNGTSHIIKRMVSAADESGKTSACNAPVRDHI